MDRVTPVPDYENPRIAAVATGAYKNGACFRIPLFAFDNVTIEIFGEGFSSLEKAREYGSAVCKALGLKEGETPVEEARRLRICRICRKPGEQFGKGDSLVLNFGKEYAHKLCLEKGRSDGQQTLEQ
jgi:hypothetical protein